MIKVPVYTGKFKKDLKRMKIHGKSRDKIEAIMDTICINGDAPAAARPHNLIGNYTGYRECHIEPDWLLIYSVKQEQAVFYRTGTHSGLF